DGTRQFVFRVAAARNHKRAKITRYGNIQLPAFRLQLRRGFGTKNGQRDGIVKHSRGIENLVSGTPHRDALRGGAGASVSHESTRETTHDTTPDTTETAGRLRGRGAGTQIVT